jgi:DNA-binding MarR family transcriptional regulator
MDDGDTADAAAADAAVEAEADAEAGELQQRIAEFVRAFGLHRPDETPCGAPVPVSEAHALAVLAERGPLAQSGLGGHLGLTKSTVSRLVDQLERRGWVTRRTGDGDARQRLVALTAEGEKVAADIARRRAERMARLLDHVPPAERAALLPALDALIEAARASA